MANCLSTLYTGRVRRRTTIEIDDALLEKAQDALGTKGLKDTVDAAFAEAIRHQLRERLAMRIKTGEGVDTSPAMLAATRPNP